MLPEQIAAWALSPNEIQNQTVESSTTLFVLHGVLTSRELEIVRLITHGLSNRQIAEQLYISQRTVDAHIRHILQRLDLNTRAQVSAWYTEYYGYSQRRLD